MTLEDIERSLPNGFHDAQIQTMTRDYVGAELIMKVLILIGLPGQPRPERDRYRTGEIVFRRVYFCSVELPQPDSPFLHPGNVWFSYERTPRDLLPDGLATMLPPGTQCYSLFVRDWFSHIHVAAQDVSFSWSDLR